LAQVKFNFTDLSASFMNSKTYHQYILGVISTLVDKIWRVNFNIYTQITSIHKIKHFNYISYWNFGKN